MRFTHCAGVAGLHRRGGACRVHCRADRDGAARRALRAGRAGGPHHARSRVRTGARCRGAAGHRQAVLHRLPQRSRQDGGRQLRRPDAAEASPQHPDLFEKAVRKMRGRVMPPPGARQPEPAAAGLRWSAGSRIRSTARRSGLPARRGGAAPAQSQGVRERGARSARVEVDAAELLPADDVSDGFDNIASGAAGVAVLHRAVRDRRAQVAVKAMGRPDARPGGWTFRAGPGTQLTHVAGPAARHARRHPRPTSISRRTASTSSTSPTSSPTSGAAAWSSRTRSS